MESHKEEHFNTGGIQAHSELMGKSTLIIGFDPNKVDLSSSPGLTAEGILHSLEHNANNLESLGCRTARVLLDPELSFEEATHDLVLELQRTHFDAVVIGAGIRIRAHSLLWFEQLVNLLHEHLPAHSRICFNTSPDDTTEAALRWLNK